MCRVTLEPDRCVERLSGCFGDVGVDLDERGAATVQPPDRRGHHRAGQAPALVIGVRADRFELPDTTLLVPPRQGVRGE